jgi:hypothetical protein
MEIPLLLPEDTVQHVARATFHYGCDFIEVRFDGEDGGKLFLFEEVTRAEARWNKTFNARNNS